MIVFADILKVINIKTCFENQSTASVIFLTISQSVRLSGGKEGLHPVEQDPRS